METKSIAPLVVIIGPTGSGKSALAMKIAQKYDGEIICADSRTVYKGMDIGTAKPTKEDQIDIPHHLLDLLNPDQPFNAAMFKDRANEAIRDITGRKKLPIMVGGTGLYIDSVLFDYAFLPPGTLDEREELLRLSVDELQQRLLESGIELPDNAQNKRHLIRKLETNGAVAVKKRMRDNTLIIGIDISKEELTIRLKDRIKQMYADGLSTEVKKLSETYGWDAPGLQTVGYQEWQDINSNFPIPDKILIHSLQYAKRQRTWFKHNPYIVWIKNSAEAMDLVHKFLRLS